MDEIFLRDGKRSLLFVIQFEVTSSLTGSDGDPLPPKKLAVFTGGNNLTINFQNWPPVKSSFIQGKLHIKHHFFNYRIDIVRFINTGNYYFVFVLWWNPFDYYRIVFIVAKNSSRFC